MTRKEYTSEILKATAVELAAVMEKIKKYELAKVKASQTWAPRLQAVSQSDVARDLACTSAALDGGYDPAVIAEVFANDKDVGKTRFLAQLLDGAREIHEKTGKGVNFPFFPFFDKRKGESLVNALSRDECKLLGVGEFEPGRSPVSGSLDAVLQHFEDRGTSGRTSAQVFCSYFSPREKEERHETASAVPSAVAPAAAPIVILDDLGDPVVAEEANIEEIGATAPVVDDSLDEPAKQPPVPKAAVTLAAPAPKKGNGKAVATNGEAAVEADELADLLTATGKPVAIALADSIRKGKISSADAQKRAQKYGLL